MNEFFRKSIHILMGFFILALKILNLWQSALCAILAFIFNLFVLPKLFPSVFREKKDLGILFYPISVLMLILLYPKNDFLVGTAWALMAFGDGTATIFGKLFPIKKLPYNENKSYGGFLSFLIFGSFSVYLLTYYFNFKTSLYTIIFITLITAFIESLKLPLVDNIAVPLFSSFLFYILIPIKSFIFPEIKNLFFSFFIVFLFAISIYLLKIIKFSAFFAGILFGTLIFYFSSLFGFLSISLFFIIGTLLTFLGFEKKRTLNIEEKDFGKRGGENVVANLIFPLFLSFLFPSFPNGDLIKVLFLSAVSTALADTSGTEFGKLFGKVVYNPINFKKVKIGEGGGISIPGIFATFFFPAIMNLILLFLSFINLKILIVCTISAFFGALSESYLKRLGNFKHSLSNFLNTVLGSAFGCLIWNLF